VEDIAALGGVNEGEKEVIGRTKKNKRERDIRWGIRRKMNEG
jgi:hypothetical protein